jgi:hypothetical protein
MIHDAQLFSTPEPYRWGFGRWYRRIQPAIGHRHAWILTVYEFTGNEPVGLGGAPRSAISVIRNGFDHILNRESRPEILQRLALKPREFFVPLATVPPAFVACATALECGEFTPARPGRRASPGSAPEKRCPASFCPAPNRPTATGRSCEEPPIPLPVAIGSLRRPTLFQGRGNRSP